MRSGFFHQWGNYMHPSIGKRGESPTETMHTEARRRVNFFQKKGEKKKEKGIPHWEREKNRWREKADKISRSSDKRGGRRRRNQLG